ncbi:hypothetical protein KFU94_10140 [Chloroflexi bacterium TSY]|nr:hypothetical protein [Chloroflexi bacterium TSY]
MRILLTAGCYRFGRMLALTTFLTALFTFVINSQVYAQSVDECKTGVNPGIPPGLVINQKVLCLNDFFTPDAHGLKLTDPNDAASGHISALPTFQINFAGNLKFEASSTLAPNFAPGEIEHFYFVSEQVANLPPSLRSPHAAEIIGPFLFGSIQTPQVHQLNSATMDAIIALQAQSSFNGVVILQIPSGGDIFTGGPFEGFAGVRFTKSTVTNTPPVLAPIPNQTVNEGENLSVTLTASDADGDNLTFTSSNLPTGAILANTGTTSATLTWQTDFNDAGVYVVDVMVEDQGTPPASASSSLTITVNDVNAPPVFDLAGLTLTINEGDVTTTTLTASDADGDNLTFTSSNLPTGASLANTGTTSATLTWQTDFNDAGVYVVDIMVEDQGTPPASASSSLTITVNDVNTPPVFDLAGLTLTINEGDVTTTTLTASDADGDNLTFTSLNLPTGANLANTGTTSATLTWQTDFNDAGVYVVDIMVEDQGTPPASASSSLTITVNDVNAPPVFDLAGLTLTINEGDVTTTTLTASDADGDNLTFTSSNLPTGASLANTGTTSATLTWQTDFNDAGVYVVDIMVEDQGTPPASASSSLTITVNDVNTPPVFDRAGLTLTINEGDVTTTTLTASDADGDNLTFTSSNLPTGALLTNTGTTSATLTWQTDFNDAGVYVVDVMVEDQGTPPASASSSLTITVNDVNTPPVFDLAGLTLTINEGDVTTTTLTASDADGDNLTFTSSNLPTGALLTNTGTTSATLTWQTDFNDAGVYVVDIMVEDQGTPPASVSSSLTITVNETNTSPRILINDLLDLEAVSTTYNPAPSPNAPSGVFTFTTTFRNNSEQMLSMIQFEVTKLTKGNLLLNADGGPGGVGSTLTVSSVTASMISTMPSSHSDGILAPNESFTVNFEIGLKRRVRFKLFVDIYGVLVNPSNTSVLPLEEQEVIQFGENLEDLLPSEVTVFLPFLTRE